MRIYVIIVYHEAKGLIKMINDNMYKDHIFYRRPYAEMRSLVAFLRNRGIKRRHGVLSLLSDYAIANKEAIYDRLVKQYISYQFKPDWAFNRIEIYSRIGYNLRPKGSQK